MNACELIQRIDTLIRGFVPRSPAKADTPVMMERKENSALPNQRRVDDDQCSKVPESSPES